MHLYDCCRHGHNQYSYYFKHREIIIPAWDGLSGVMVVLHAIALKFKPTQFQHLLFTLTNFNLRAEGIRFVRMGYTECLQMNGAV